MEEAQSLSVKRAEVEWHNFAALGEPDRVLAAYTKQNLDRGALIRKHLPFIGALKQEILRGSTSSTSERAT